MLSEEFYNKWSRGNEPKEIGRMGMITLVINYGRDYAKLDRELEKTFGKRLKREAIE